MEKLNANSVGIAAHSDPIKQNGITLIALIITIIVMLILVGVTINVALNGALFQKAEYASEQTKKAVEKEELIQIALGEYDIQNKIVNKNNVIAQTTEKYTEDTSKSVDNEILVLQGESKTLWEINLKTSEVKEYKEKSENEYKVYTSQQGQTIVNIIIFENGDFKQIVNGSVVFEGKKHKTEENVEMIINGENAIYDKAFFTTIFDNNDDRIDDYTFSGYFESETKLYVLSGVELNINGNNISGASFLEFTLDKDTDVSTYL